MKFSITPMSFGEIFSRVISLLKSRFGAFLLIGLVQVLPTLALQLALPEFCIDPARGFLLLLPMAILGPIVSAAMLHVIAQEYLEQPVSIREALTIALSRFLPLLGTGILAGLGIGLGMLCCVPGIYLTIIWAFFGQVVVMENIAGSSALGRSKSLVKDYFWHVFAVIIVAQLCVGLMSFAIGGGLGMALPFQEIQVGNQQMPVARLTSYVNYAIVNIVDNVVNAVGQAFAAICVTLLYFDLRNRKEAFDVSHIVTWMDQYRDWRDEPVPSDPAGGFAGSPETGIKQVGDVVPPPPPETGIQDPNAPRPSNEPPPR